MECPVVNTHSCTNSAMEEQPCVVSSAVYLGNNQVKAPPLCRTTLACSNVCTLKMILYNLGDFVSVVVW